MNKPNKTSFERTQRNTVRRVPKRANYDADTLHHLFDQAWFCHVGFLSETGPTIIPMLHARLDDRIILHGATTSRLMMLLASGGPIDDKDDYQLDIWAGVVPLREQILPPVSDPLSHREVAIPEYIEEFRRHRNG